MRRIAIAVMGTISGLVMLFSYHTSTNSQVATTGTGSGTGTSDSAATGSSTDSSDSSGSDSSGSDSGSSSSGSSDYITTWPTSSAVIPLSVLFWIHSLPIRPRSF